MQHPNIRSRLGRGGLGGRRDEQELEARSKASAHAEENAGIAGQRRVTEGPVARYGPVAPVDRLLLGEEQGRASHGAEDPENEARDAHVSF